MDSREAQLPCTDQLCITAAATTKVDEERSHGAANGAANGGGTALSEKHVALMNEGIGDPMSYRKRKGRFTILEWLMSVILPILVILLGALSLMHTALLLCACAQHMRPLQWPQVLRESMLASAAAHCGKGRRFPGSCLYTEQFLL